MKLIAQKPFSYATRRLLPNDEFEATAAHGRLLVAIGKARESDARVKGKLAPPSKKLTKKVSKAAPARKVEPKPERTAAAAGEAVGAMTTETVRPATKAKADEPAALATAPEDDLAALRQQYKDKFGKSPFMGWSVATLQDKLAEKPAS